MTDWPLGSPPLRKGAIAHCVTALKSFIFKAFDHIDFRFSSTMFVKDQPSDFNLIWATCQLSPMLFSWAIAGLGNEKLRRSGFLTKQLTKERQYVQADPTL
jgi:hypothetical protein